MHYELWDHESRNLLDDFEGEAEALATIRKLATLNAHDPLETLTLVRVDDDGRSVALASGWELITWACKTGPIREPRSA